MGPYHSFLLLESPGPMFYDVFPIDPCHWTSDKWGFHPFLTWWCHCAAHKPLSLTSSLPQSRLSLFLLGSLLNLPENPTIHTVSQQKLHSWKIIDSWKISISCILLTNSFSYWVVFIQIACCLREIKSPKAFDSNHRFSEISWNSTKTFTSLIFGSCPCMKSHIPAKGWAPYSSFTLQSLTKHWAHVFKSLGNVWKYMAHQWDMTSPIKSNSIKCRKRGE